MCDIRLPLPGDLPQAIAVNCVQETDKYQRLSNGRVASSDLDGMRILLIEDEPLVAMELEAQLTSLGAEVIGPAGTVERARQLNPRIRPMRPSLTQTSAAVRLTILRQH